MRVGVCDICVGFVCLRSVTVRSCVRVNCVRLCLEQTLPRARCYGLW